MRKIAVYLCLSLLLVTVGCSNSDADSDVPTVERIYFNDVIDTNAEENNSNYLSSRTQADNAQPDSSRSQADNVQLQSDSELDGSIESIGDNSVVINKTFHPSANISVSYEDSDKVLVTVYFSDETGFEVWTVKNGGVNGDADTEKRQGAFSDLKQGANIKVTGSYDGNDFHAQNVIIYNFV